MFLRAATEIAAYAALAVAMAIAVALYVNSRMTPGSSSRLIRAPQDASFLASSLKLPAGQNTIIEFMDFQCPPCRATYPQIKSILAAHEGVVYRAVNFPLSFHQFALGAAVAFEIARENGQGNQVFDDLFTASTELDSSSLNEYLKHKGLPALVGKGGSARFKRMVERDKELSSRLHVNATPTIMILTKSGSLVEIHGLDEISSILDSP
jgi:protein-disulfide isomerase